MPSSQSSASPLSQVPPEHWSPVVQTLPSSQTLASASLARQLSAPSSHVSAQLPSPSAPGHGSPVCTVQSPVPSHVSVPLQNAASLQGVLAPAKALAGHELVTPVQLSSTSQTSTAPRQSTVLARNPLAGQFAFA